MPASYFLRVPKKLKSLFTRWGL